MKNLLTALVLAVVMVCSVILVSGCQESCPCMNNRVAASPAEAPSAREAAALAALGIK